MSSVEKLVQEELLTSKGTSRFPDAVISVMFGISSSIGAMLKSQEVLLDRIETIAQKMETLENMVFSLKEDLKATSERSLSRSRSLSLEEIKGWMNSPPTTQIPGSSMELQCSETLFPEPIQSNDPEFMFDGFTDLQEWVNHV